MKLNLGVTSRKSTVFVSMNTEEVNEAIDVDSPLIDPPPKNPPALNLICVKDNEVKSRKKIIEKVNRLDILKNFICFL